jgi:hypothetical protein
MLPAKPAEPSVHGLTVCLDGIQLRLLLFRVLGTSRLMKGLEGMLEHLSADDM